MSAYRLHVIDAGGETSEHLECLDDLAERVALEQLTHELNPFAPGGYTVAFRVTTARFSSEDETMAEGHFYVRSAVTVPAPAEFANRYS